MTTSVGRPMQSPPKVTSDNFFVSQMKKSLSKTTTKKLNPVNKREANIRNNA